MKLADLISGLETRELRGSCDVEIESLSHDSRTAGPGSLFFALSGSSTDGNRYIKEALDRGAVGVVSELRPPPAPFALASWSRPGRAVAWIETPDALAAMSAASSRFYGNPSSALRVFGVTGTNGKTTTTYFLESIFESVGAPSGVIGTVSYRVKGRELESAKNTTPLSLELQRLLWKMREASATHVAMEVSSHALSLRRVEDVEFSAAVFTNLRRDHLDYHKTPEQYLEAKARLFDLQSKLGQSRRERVAVINRDDAAFAKLKRRVAGPELITYGLNPDSTLRVLSVAPSMQGTIFRFAYKGQEWSARLKLIGGYNAMNAAAAAAACLWFGHPMEKVLAGLERLPGVPGRLETVSEGQPFNVFVDFAHTDSALEEVLRSLQEASSGRILTVFGCGGDRDKTKRGPMGKVACERSAEVFLTSDNPRSESPAEILRQIEDGIKNAGRQNYKIIPDRAEAIAAAIGAAREGDVVLIAGKGHETYQILRDKSVHFDDRESARESLRRRFGK